MIELLSELTKLPKPSSIRATGCCENGIPAVAEGKGCVCNVRRLAEPGPILIAAEVALVRLLLANVIVMFVATLWDRFRNVTTPFAATAFRFPCKVPAPPPREAV